MKKLGFVLTCLVMILAISAPTFGQDKKPNWKKELRTKIEALYPLSKANFLTEQIGDKHGAVLVIQKSGLLVDRAGKLNHIKNGEVTGMTSGDKVGLFLRAARDTSGTYDPDTETPVSFGQKVYLTAVSVDDDILRLLIQTQGFNRFTVGNKDAEHSPVMPRTTTRDKQYTGTLSFEFEKGYLESAGFDEIKSQINKFLRDEKDPQLVHRGEADLTGKSPKQVEAAMGPPTRRLTVGTKLIFFYPGNVKVTFVDDKVTDVE